ncbi:MAG TPA: hypothetical protein VD836_00850 [Solirubrobacteraceae bacterium]|nr:hypothetical protein [Solirubrobacteraceae bacterium]
MGFQLGPAFLRKPPKGWLPASASTRRHVVYDWPSGGPDGGGSDWATTCLLDADWRVEPEGREPYEFHEERRTGPAWAQAALVGGGGRWYRLRVKPTYGLMDGVAFRVWVDPADRTRLWVDWDDAYERHVTAWERKARVEREAARLSSRWEHAVERVLNPLSGRATDEEREDAARLDAERRAEVARQEERVRERAEATAAATGNTTTEAQDDDLRARSDELGRIHAEGRRTTAIVVGRTDTGRRIGPIPVIEITFDVDDGPAPRRVVHEHVFGARAAKHYKPGRTVEVWIDPQDPDAICPGR